MSQHCTLTKSSRLTSLLQRSHDSKSLHMTVVVPFRGYEYNSLEFTLNLRNKRRWTVVTSGYYVSRDMCLIGSVTG